MHLSVPISQIYNFASYLHSLGQGRIIYKVSARNIYIPSACAPLSQLSATHFAPSTQPSTASKPLELSKLMMDLSTPRPFASLIHSKELRQLYIDALVFLLVNDYVVQLHMYLCTLSLSQIYKSQHQLQ